MFACQGLFQLIPLSVVDSQIVVFFGQDCCCSRDMKYYYLCFNKEALIVQETFLNWYVNAAKKYFYTLSFYGTSSKYSYKKAK